MQCDCWSCCCVMNNKIPLAFRKHNYLVILGEVDIITKCWWFGLLPLPPTCLSQSGKGEGSLASVFLLKCARSSQNSCMLRQTHSITVHLLFKGAYSQPNPINPIQPPPTTERMTPPPSYQDYVAVVLIMVCLSPDQCVSVRLPAVTTLRADIKSNTEAAAPALVCQTPALFLKSVYMHIQQLYTNQVWKTTTRKPLKICAICFERLMHQNVLLWQTHTCTYMHCALVLHW